jgi:hypothetical protein
MRYLFIRRTIGRQQNNQTFMNNYYSIVIDSHADGVAKNPPNTASSHAPGVDRVPDRSLGSPQAPCSENGSASPSK